MLNGKLYELSSRKGTGNFGPYTTGHPRPSIETTCSKGARALSRLMSVFLKRAYYTPLALVDKAYDKLTETLGNSWQKEYIVWDMCCGVGNLEVKHSNSRNILHEHVRQCRM
jgi:hypothetical protein